MTAWEVVCFLAFFLAFVAGGVRLVLGDWLLKLANRRIAEANRLLAQAIAERNAAGRVLAEARAIQLETSRMLRESGEHAVSPTKLQH